ncbi:MAG: S26 family signal peptidase, partial [Polaribacter sp.]
FIDYCKAYNITYSEIVAKHKIANLTDADAEKLRIEKGIDSVMKNVRPAIRFDKSVFPHNINYVWNMDNFGPIYIPKKGATVKINAKTIPFYEQIIRRYENNDLTIFDDNIYINGKKATTYTFKKDYYWMMGDNRQRSLDARAWGYTPFDHIVGKPILIWFSWDAKKGKPRWDRMFTTIPTVGEPKSYFWIGILCFIAILVFVFKPKKKEKK